MINFLYQNYLDIFNLLIAILMIGYGIFLIINTYLKDKINTGINFYMNILGIQFFLKSLGIKYLFWQTTVPLINTSPEMKTFYNLIDTKFFPYATNQNYNFMNIAKTKGYKISNISSKGNFRSHYDEKAQIDFAKYLYKIITSRQLFK